MTARAAVLHARAALVLEEPFFGALALRLDLQEDPSCATAWTDGRTIGYSPDYVLGLTHPQLVGLIAHEVMHVASGHPWRREARDPQRWNEACDYAINRQLLDAGLSLPEGALLDARWAGRSAEDIYARLPDQQDQDEPGAGAPGEVRDAPTDPDPDGTPAPTEAEWQQAVQQAAQVARARGDLPGALERFASAALRPRVDWRAALQRFMQERARADYTWTRPNTRYLARGLYLPALHSASMGRIAVAVDVSGSVDQVLLDQFSAELQAILDLLQPDALDVLYCDTAIRRREEYAPGDRVELRACGGGGTWFTPVFDALAEDTPPVCLVYLTDLYGWFPDHAPEYPVLWAATSDATAPFGETIRVL